MSEVRCSEVTKGEPRLAIVGLGYVGLPLAVEFARVLDVVGFDIDEERVAELKQGVDRTLEATSQDLAASSRLSFSSNVSDIAGCNVFIVTVPTPIDEAKRPDLTPLLSASRTVGGVLKRGDTVVFESTVFPGCTEEVCIPQLEKASGLILNSDFTVGYSPERINPGDRDRRLTSIKKVTSGSSEESAEFVDSLYRRIITAGTYKAGSIKVAEAAKVIENTQRDLNIALMNDLAVLFHRMDIDTTEVLQAAGTKWNFLPFKPGLVGGHCIGVDPYYLTHKAQELGHHPQVILAGRRANDSMGAYIGDRVLKLLVDRGVNPVNSKCLVLGFAFKENCPDHRNTKVIDLVRRLQYFRVDVDVYDPWVRAREVRREFGLDLMEKLSEDTYDAIVVAVAHTEFVDMGCGGLRSLGRDGCVIFDVKSVFAKTDVDGRL